MSQKRRNERAIYICRLFEIGATTISHVPLSLSLGTTLRKRRQPSSRQQPAEKRDPTSARFHYRAFLLAMTRQETPEHRRRLSETPEEYQVQLLAQSPPGDPSDTDSTPAKLFEKLIAPLPANALKAKYQRLFNKRLCPGGSLG